MMNGRQKAKNGKGALRPFFISCFLFIIFHFLLVSFSCPLCLGGEPATPHRSPTAVAVLPDGHRALTANHSADSVSLVDLGAAKVLAEVTCGRKPVSVACSADGRRAAVSNHWSESVTLLDVDDTTLKAVGTVAVGRLPQGLVFAPDGRRLFAAVGGADEVVEIDTATRAVTHRWPAPREPRRLAVSKDGRLLAAASSRSARVRLWNTATHKLLWERKIEDGFNLRGLAFTPDEKALICGHVVRREFPVSKQNIAEGWVIDSRLTRLPVKADAVPPLLQVALDTKGAAVGDPHGVAFGGRGRYLAITAAGTQELLLFEAAALPWNGGEPGDFLDPSLAKSDGRMRRLALGGRPMGVAVTSDGTRAVVANYLLNAVQVVDLTTGRLERTVPLGGPREPSPARRGAALFYDARRSHNHWFSCHTCHVDGHTCGLNFDTLNDDSYGNPKLTPSLRRVAHTGPWTWHGWQNDLGAAVVKSYTETMFGPKPTADEVRDVVAFLETLDHPPLSVSRSENRKAVERGQALFEGKARCARCHSGPDYTSARNYDVKLQPDGSPYELWNPPTLRGLIDRGPFLHDGRAQSLEDLLKEDHSPEKLGGQPLNPAERADLIAFLRSV
jgi:YVTN family beta-propeller protein